MNEQRSKLSKQEIEASLKQVQGSEDAANALLKADSKLISLAAVSYGFSVFNFGYSGNLGVDSTSSILALVGFLVFIGVVATIERKHKALGVKQKRMPSTVKGVIQAVLYGGFFAATYVGAFFLNTQGLVFAPAVCGLAAACMLWVLMTKYPNFHAQP